MYLSEREVDLELLHLGTNYFTDEGLINVLSGLQYHTNLKELYLGKNYLFGKYLNFVLLERQRD